MLLLQFLQCPQSYLLLILNFLKLKITVTKFIKMSFPFSVPRCLAYEVITLFPLHDIEKLKSLEKNWYANFQRWDIPIGRQMVHIACTRFYLVI